MFGEPCVGGVLACEDLQVALIANLPARIDVDPNSHRTIFHQWFLCSSLLPPSQSRLKHTGGMDRDCASHSFQCPNLDCSEKYVVVIKDQPPDKSPRCVECDTPFLAKDDRGF